MCIRLILPRGAAEASVTRSLEPDQLFAQDNNQILGGVLVRHQRTTFAHTTVGNPYFPVQVQDAPKVTTRRPSAPASTSSSPPTTG